MSEQGSEHRRGPGSLAVSHSFLAQLGASGVALALHSDQERVIAWRLIGSVVSSFFVVVSKRRLREWKLYSRTVINRLM
jgi:hypothetical protein